jgi:hypothetical protein
LVGIVPHSARALAAHRQARAYIVPGASNSLSQRPRQGERGQRWAETAAEDDFFGGLSAKLVATSLRGASVLRHARTRDALPSGSRGECQILASDSRRTRSPSFTEQV